MSTATPNLIDLLEYARGTAGQPPKIDRENGIIYGVKVLGEAGNAVYPRATREKAAALIEGARVNIDHAPRSQAGETRSYRDAFGTVKNVREEGSGLFADYHFPAKHPLAESLFWDAEHAPQRLGFSIASRGRASRTDADGRQIIEEILFDPHSHSVDLVSAPATTKGLSESRRNPPMKKKIKAVLESHFKSPAQLVVLREMAESGVLGPDAEMEAPAESSSSDDQIKAAFRNAVLAAFDDDKLDSKATLGKIKDILKAYDKLKSDSGKSEDSGSGGGGSEPPADKAEEGRRRTADGDKLALLEAKDLVRTAADDAGIRVPSAVLDTIRPGLTSAQAKALVESLKPGGQRAGSGGNPPLSSGRDAASGSGGSNLRESRDVPKDSKDRKAWLNSAR